jgi:hypothetical protein
LTQRNASRAVMNHPASIAARGRPPLEGRMAETGDSATPHRGVLERISNWWRQGELSALPTDEVDRIAADLGMSTSQLHDLAAQGPGGADLLYERLDALGVSRADVERMAHGLMRDLERDCACCADKGRCSHDLASRPDDAVWTQYCPNAATLQALQRTRGRAPI